MTGAALCVVCRRVQEDERMYDQSLRFPTPKFPVYYCHCTESKNVTCSVSAAHDRCIDQVNQSYASGKLYYKKSGVVLPIIRYNVN